MGIDKYKNHLLIISEDDAYKDMALGFVNSLSQSHCVKVEKSVGGWAKVIPTLIDEYASSVRKFARRHVLLLMDLDDNIARVCKVKSKASVLSNIQTRLDNVISQIPIDIRDRVFVLCAKTNAEAIKAYLGYGRSEDIGRKLAESCRMYSGHSASMWDCEQLMHNKSELERLIEIVHPWF